MRHRDGGAYWFWLPEALQRALYELDTRVGAQVRFDELDVTANELKRFATSSLMEEAIASSQIEGAQTTREVARDMLRQGRSPRSRGERMVLNNYKTILRIRDLKRQPLSPEMLIELQELMTRGTLDDPGAVGRLRRAREDICVVDVRDNTVLHDPPPADELPARLAALCNFANEAGGDDHFIHPIVRAVLLHLWLAYDHPFVDGNGRTARALFYWYALRRGYWLFEYLPISRIIATAPVRYGRAFLHAESDGCDATYFLAHGFRVIHAALADLWEYLRAQRNRLQSARALRRQYDALGLNHRQISVIQDAINAEIDDYTIEAHRRIHGVSYGSANTDLNELVRRGLFERGKRGKKLVFNPVDDLASRLQREGK